MADASDATPLDLTGQVVRSLTLYALAEFQSGHATALAVQARGRSFSVSDNGRGHGLDRKVSGVSYLQVIYNQLEYPFPDGQAGEVQLQGIGLSLINTVCAELRLTVRKPSESLRITYRAGRLCEEQRLAGPQSETGNTLKGEVRAELQHQPTDEACLHQWLRRLHRAHPGLALSFNGRPVQWVQP